eukprot:1153410-Pelagomonas_calceolata.AAC.1
MADRGPCCSFPLLPLQWLSSSPASTAAALIAALHVLAGVSCAPMRGCHRKAFRGKGSFKGEKGKMRSVEAPLTTHSPSCLKSVQFSRPRITAHSVIYFLYGMQEWFNPRGYAKIGDTGNTVYSTSMFRAYET